METGNISIIFVAGGSGKRMGAPIPKQFLLLNGKPIFTYAIQHFHQTFPEGQIILVLPQDHIHTAKKLAAAFIPDINIQYTSGGDTRYQSVANGLKLVEQELVMVHDAVRPFINKALLKRLYKVAITHGNAIPAIPMIESVRIIKGNKNEAIDRDTIKIIQTPQTFKTQLLKNAFQTGYRSQFTDDASVLEYAGHTIHLTEGIKENIKITTPNDISIAESFISSNWQ